MRHYDFGTCQAFVDDDVIKLTFSKLHDELKDLVRSRWRASWDKARFCYSIDRRNIQEDIGTIVNAISETLYSAAPRNWRGIAAKYSHVACATKKFEVKVGAGGLRVTLPPGHKSHSDISTWLNSKQTSNTWELPAKSVSGRQMFEVLNRIVTEDFEAYQEETEPYAGRLISGTLRFSAKDAERFKSAVGSILFASESFLQIGDPTVVDATHNRRIIRNWPLKIVGFKEQPAPDLNSTTQCAFAAQLEYLMPVEGYNAILGNINQSDVSQPIRLDSPNTSHRWKFKNPFDG